MSGQVQDGDKVSWDWDGSHPSGTAGEVKAGEVTVTSHRGNEISKTGDESNLAVHIDRSGNDVVNATNELNVESKGSVSETNKQNGTSEQKEDEKKEDEKKEDEKKEDEKKEEHKAQRGEEKGEEKKEAESEKKEEESNSDQDEEKKDEEMPDAEADGEAKAGDKRKADEKVDAKSEKKQEENGDDKKKQKTKANGTAPINCEKKKAGRPRNDNSAPKKEKKEPAVGKAQRKTRSQGAA
ncbi:hypothetical protein BJ875DRAFT_474957 [Amylocarpus encephaloides]|uniref:Hypervirulence associated protein TUDOR domain-containing protein n=1 Tax=Amylocarpus encephaloides TaxID=45428 RepID=A0A9P7Y9L9_9HELO|nr:hypothetical protein BJ875DRAFT_474957 [Amylocarpus encephaloides]